MTDLAWSCLVWICPLKKSLKNLKDTHILSQGFLVKALEQKQ